MYRGTTPTLIFTVDLDVSNIQVLCITFKQGVKIQFEKSLSDCTLDTTNKTISIKLSEEETLQLIPNKDLNIQLRLKLSDNSVYASQEMQTYVNDILHDGLLT